MRRLPEWLNVHCGDPVSTLVTFTSKTCQQLADQYAALRPVQSVQSVQSLDLDIIESISDERIAMAEMILSPRGQFQYIQVNIV